MINVTLSLVCIVFDHFKSSLTCFLEKNTSYPVNNLEGSKVDKECGARLDSLKKTKNPVRKMALYTGADAKFEH